jgi:hypothetical protein
MNLLAYNSYLNLLRYINKTHLLTTSRNLFYSLNNPTCLIVRTIFNKSSKMQVMKKQDKNDKQNIKYSYNYNYTTNINLFGLFLLVRNI